MAFFFVIFGTYAFEKEAFVNMLRFFWRNSFARLLCIHRSSFDKTCQIEVFKLFDDNFFFTFCGEKCMKINQTFSKKSRASIRKSIQKATKVSTQHRIVLNLKKRWLLNKINNTSRSTSFLWNLFTRQRALTSFLEPKQKRKKWKQI